MPESLPAELAAEAWKAARLAARHYGKRVPELAAREGDEFEGEALCQALRAVPLYDPTAAASPLTYFYHHAYGAIQRYHECLSPGGRSRCRVLAQVEARVRKFAEQIEAAEREGRTDELPRLRRLLERAEAARPTPADLLPLSLSLLREFSDTDLEGGENHLEDRLAVSTPGPEALVVAAGGTLEVGELATAAALDPRERRFLWLYFWEGHSQDRIARNAGISQMHVSRVIRRALARLRAAWEVSEQS